MISLKAFGLIAVAGLALTGFVVTAGAAASGASTGLQCGVITNTNGGMMTIEGTVLSPVAITGEYQFSIRSRGNGGSSNVSQSSNFSAAANELTQLGNVSVNAGSSLDIVFDVTISGKTIDCTEQAAKVS